MKQLHKRLASLVAMGGLFLGFSWWVGQSQDDLNASTEERSKDAKIYSFLSPLDVTGIEINNAHGRFVLRRERDAQDVVGQWILEAPALGNADLVVVEGILAQVLPVRRRLTIPNPAKLSLEERKTEYGLVEPSQSLTLKTSKAAETVHFGMSNAFDQSMYALISSESEIVSVPNTLRHQLDKQLFDLRNKQLVEFEVEDVSSLNIAFGEKTLVFKTEEGAWSLIDGDARLPVAGERMTDLLQDIRALKFNRILAERATAADLKKHDYPKEAWTLSLGFGEQSDDVMTLRLALTTVEELEVLLGFADRNNPLGELVRGRWPSLLKGGFQGLVDRRVLPVTLVAGDSLELHNGDSSVQFSLSDDDVWSSGEGPAGNLRQSRVKGLVFSLSQLEKIRVVSESIDLVEAQSQRAISTQRRLVLRSGTKEWVLYPQDGEEPNEVWVNGTVFQVDATRLSDLLWDPKDYRSQDAQ